MLYEFIRVAFFGIIIEASCSDLRFGRQRSRLISSTSSFFSSSKLGDFYRQLIHDRVTRLVRIFPLLIGLMQMLNDFNLLSVWKNKL